VVAWIRRRLEALLDNLVWLAVVAAVVAVGGSIVAFGGERLTLHVWEAILVAALFVAVAVCLVVLFIRAPTESRPVVAPEVPRRHAALLSRIEALARDMEKQPDMGYAPWHMAQVYHDLRSRAINECPNSAAALASLPVFKEERVEISNALNVHLRVPIGQLLSLVEQDTS
jgi:hypothetical protein